MGNDLMPYPFFLLHFEVICDPLLSCPRYSLELLKLKKKPCKLFSFFNTVSKEYQGRDVFLFARKFFLASRMNFGRVHSIVESQSALNIFTTNKLIE